MKHPATARNVFRSNDDADGQTVYLDAIGRYGRLSADAELAAARRLVTLRAELWYAVFSHDTELARVRTTLRELTARVPQARAAIEALGAARRDADRRARTIMRVAQAVARTGLDPVCVRSIVGRDPERSPEGDAWRDGVLRALARYCGTRDAFVRANLRLVAALAREHGGRHLPLADRIQEGNLALMHAIDRFDPDRGVRFATYAVWWIRHRIGRAAKRSRRLVPVPYYVHSLFATARKVEPRLRARLGRDPTDGELAADLGLDPKTVTRMREIMDMRTVPLQEFVEGALVHEAELGARLDHARNTTLAQLGLAALEDIEREILLHRFGSDDAATPSLRALGLRYGCSGERVRQIQNGALAKLRTMIDASPTPSMAFAPVACRATG